MLRVSRVIASLVLLLHVAVAGVLPLADARSDVAGNVISASAHVESPERGSCPQVHDDATCQLCHLLRLPGQASEKVALPPVARAVVVPAVAREARSVRGQRPASDQARAPPVG